MQEINIPTVISVHLGSGEEGQKRKETLENIANEFGLEWGGQPSIGRLIIAIAERYITMTMHNLSMPENAGKGLTSWIAVCSCGAQWRCEYIRKGLHWTALKPQCEHCPYND